MGTSPAPVHWSAVHSKGELCMRKLVLCAVSENAGGIAWGRLFPFSCILLSKMNLSPLVRAHLYWASFDPTEGVVMRRHFSGIGCGPCGRGS